MKALGYFAFLFILVTIFRLTQSFNPCSVVQFQDFFFDLTTLPKDDILTLYQNNQKETITFHGCTPQTCEGTAINEHAKNYKSFFQREINGICQPFTVNATILQNFDYINNDNKKEGIRINYLPYIQRNDTDGIIKKYHAILNIYCSEIRAQKDGCEVKKVTTTDLIEENLVCNIHLAIGCPQLTTNNFWQFLIDNKVWFSILLWIISLFQLFFGYFVIRLTILIYGIMTGAVIGIIFSAQNYVNFFYDYTGNGIRIFIVILCFFMGLLYGITLLTLPKLGYMNIGLWVAIIFALLLQNSFLYQTGSMVAFYITLGVTALIMMAISLLGFRKFIIFSTAFTSAFCLVRTLGFILPYYPNEFASEKLFAINESTPWQFYLYLVSIIIIAILGGTFQFCWYKKKGRDQGNKGYYLQNDDNLKDKMKKLLQFDGIKDAIKKGKDEVMMLKNLVVEESDENSEEQIRQPKKKQKPKQEIQLKTMNRKETKIFTPTSNPSPLSVSKQKVVKSQMYSKKDLEQKESQLQFPSDEDEDSEFSEQKKVVEIKKSIKKR